MITIEYCAEGEPVSDFNYEEWLNKVKSSNNSCFKVSTSLAIDVIRLAILKKELYYNKIIFKYKDQEIKANEYGTLKEWPKGFCDISMNIAFEILDLANKERKLELNKKPIKA